MRQDTFKGSAEHVTSQGKASRICLQNWKAISVWQSRRCRKADLVHKRLLLSVSSLRVVETGLKDRTGAVLHPVSLHLCVLCSVLFSITQHPGPMTVQVSPSDAQEMAASTRSGGWETQGSPRMTNDKFYGDFVGPI